MILNNLKKLLWASARGLACRDTYIRRYDGSIRNFTNEVSALNFSNHGFDKDFNSNVSGKSGYIGLLLGTGTGEITENDYCMFELFSDYTSVSGILTDETIEPYVYSSDIFTAIKAIKNTSESPVTITELGLCGCHYYDYETAYALLTHDLLDEPVTIQPGENYTFTLTVRL